MSVMSTAPERPEVSVSATGAKCRGANDQKDGDEIHDAHPGKWRFAWRLRVGRVPELTKNKPLDGHLVSHLRVDGLRRVVDPFKGTPQRKDVVQASLLWSSPQESNASRTHGIHDIDQKPIHWNSFPHCKHHGSPMSSRRDSDRLRVKNHQAGPSSVSSV